MPTDQTAIPFHAPVSGLEAMPSSPLTADQLQTRDDILATEPSATELERVGATLESCTYTTVMLRAMAARLSELGDDAGAKRLTEFAAEFAALEAVSV